jgi:hypothetical protein
MTIPTMIPTTTPRTTTKTAMIMMISSQEWMYLITRILLIHLMITKTSMNINRIKTMTTKRRMTKTTMVRFLRTTPKMMTATKNKNKPRLKSLLLYLRP